MSGNFTGTGTGGDVFKVDLNEQFDRADMVWIGTASVLVWIMIPGVGLLYSGISRKKHALSLMWAALMAACVAAFQWFWWGYSLVLPTMALCFRDLAKLLSQRCFGCTIYC